MKTQEEIKRYNREYYHSHGKSKYYFTAEGARARRQSQLKIKYGITLEQYDKLFKNQRGLCAICGKAETTKGYRNLTVDHSHNTGEVRALLCRKCNVALGLLNDDSELFLKASNYLEGLTTSGSKSRPTLAVV